SGSVELSDKKPPHSLRLRMDGRGLPGWVKGEGELKLAAKKSETEVSYTGDAQVGGMIASVGQRMMESAAKKIVQQFFEDAAKQLKT
ncbi:MAG: SRPBCC domain-containing protein, partial [Terriglobales bacterium]